MCEAECCWLLVVNIHVGSDTATLLKVLYCGCGCFPTGDPAFEALQAQRSELPAASARADCLALLQQHQVCMHMPYTSHLGSSPGLQAVFCCQ